MIVINSGVPRSGTILVNAFVRHLIGGPVRQENLFGPHMVQRLRALRDEGVGRPTIVHAHDWTETTLDLVRTNVGFLNMRDPRDVAISLATLHDLSLGEAAEMTLDAFGSFGLAFAHTNWVVIRYEMLVSDPRLILKSVADELRVPLSDARVNDVLAATSANQHSNVMRRVVAGSIPRRAVVNPRRTLWEDPLTLINDRHIQSGVVGRWRTELAPRDAAALGEALAHPIAQYGY